MYLPLISLFILLINDIVHFWRGKWRISELSERPATGSAITVGPSCFTQQIPTLLMVIWASTQCRRTTAFLMYAFIFKISTSSTLHPFQVCRTNIYPISSLIFLLLNKGIAFLYTSAMVFFSMPFLSLNHVTACEAFVFAFNIRKYYCWHDIHICISPYVYPIHIICYLHM